MKKILAFALAAGCAGAAFAQTSISIGINQPGVYGRINIGDVPRPALYYPEPVIVTPPYRALLMPMITAPSICAWTRS